LVAGGVLAQRFRFVVLAPATFVVVVVSIAVGVARTDSVWSIILTIAAASAGMQIGYFIGMLMHYGLGALLAQRSAVVGRAQGAARR
jgi:membrane protein DedA with SNARE-associated domain